MLASPGLADLLISSVKLSDIVMFQKDMISDWQTMADFLHC